MSLVFSSSSLSSSSCSGLLTKLARNGHPRVLIPAPVFLLRSRRKQAFIVDDSNLSSNAVDPPLPQRRFAQYHPTIWGPNIIDALTTHYSYESHATKLESLKQNVAESLVASSTKDDACLILKLIDSIHRLGIGYHFEKEIQTALANVLSSGAIGNTSDLNTAALGFRILRQYGISISSDLFNKFRSGHGSFKDSLSDDVEGLLSLYEASHLEMPGEDVLEEAKRFSSKYLRQSMGTILNKDDLLTKQVEQSLQTPLHWRMPRIEALNFINIYQRDISRNPALLELAKLDYNLVQSVYQKEIKELSRWWSDLDFKSKASFSRDRLLENYLWAMGIIYEPQFSICRIGLTKFVCILTVIDDMYDVYGFLDELEYFTDAVIKWNMETKEELPEYMKPIYIAMLEFGNEMMADYAFKNSGIDTLPIIKNEWVNLCMAYMAEARWFYGGYTPTLEEYLNHAWTSVGCPGAMLHAYLLTEGCQLTKASLESFNHGSQLIYWASIMGRLSDDLGTSKAEGERGDVAKSIQCYMKEKGVTEEEARDYIKGLISYSWKKMNQESANTSIPKLIVNMCLNGARTAHCIFEHGDGIGNSIGATRDRLISLIANPVLAPSMIISQKNLFKL